MLELTATCDATATHATAALFSIQKVENGRSKAGKERLDALFKEGMPKDVDNVLH